MTVQPDGQQPDGRKLSGGAIVQNTDRVRFQFLF
jgi:hypothetical protein